LSGIARDAFQLDLLGPSGVERSFVSLDWSEARQAQKVLLDDLIVRISRHRTFRKLCLAFQRWMKSAAEKP